MALLQGLDVSFECEPRKGEVMATTPSKPSLVASVERLFKEVFYGGKYPLLDELLAPDFTFQYPHAGFSAGGKGIQQFSELFHTALPKFEFEIHDLFGTDDGVAIRWTVRGHHQGSFLGIPATGQYVSVSAIGLYKPPHQGGTKIGQGWLEMDTVGLLQQMKRLPPEGELFPGIRQS
ncbi:MAG: ester cyclase [Aliidongia sp.]